MAAPSSLQLFTRLENLLYDVRFSALPPERKPRSPILIIDVDERSIQQEGRWPWPRDKVARLLEHLQALGVTLIGLDVIFSEPELNPAHQLLSDPTLSINLRQELDRLAASHDADSQLAAAVARNAVLGYFFQAEDSSSGELPFPFHQFSDDELPRSRLLHMPSYTASIPVLAANALDQGFVIAPPDSDGIMRRMPMVVRHAEGVYASLSVAMAQQALDAQWIKLILADNGHQLVATGLDLGGKVHIPLSADGSLLIPFRGPAGSFPFISATSILQDTLNESQRQQLQGALVLVGSSALGLSDLHTTPLQTLYPGVEAHANLLDAILQTADGRDSFYRQPDWAPGASLLFQALTALILMWILPGRVLPVLLLRSLLATLLVIGLNFWLWHQLHLALPLLFSLLTCLLLAALFLLGGFAVSNYSRQLVQQLFGTYVPPEYVRLLLHAPHRASMEGEQREMTVLFADVCGFTRLSESLSTSELKQMLNLYLTEVTGIIFEHSGTIDKYVGDMVMAFWNAPLDNEQHASHGVQTALAMLQRVKELDPVFTARGWPVIRIGIGLNTGPMNVGDMGSSYRRAYTVLGDAVNLGSRLEGLTRYYGLGCLVSDQTRQQCPDILFLPIDRVRVVGKDEPLEIFAPLGLLSQCNEQQLRLVEDFTTMLALYRQRQFAKAAQLLTALQAHDPGHELLYQRYQERIHEFMQSPPPADWQAIHAHTSK